MKRWAIVIVVAAALLWVLSKKDGSGDGVSSLSPQTEAHSANARFPVTALESARADGSRESPTALAASSRPALARMLASTEFAADMKTLLHEWERDTVEVLHDVTEKASARGGSTLVLHLPAFGDAAGEALEKLVAKHAGRHGLEVKGEALRQQVDAVRGKFIWPEKPRILLASAGVDGKDSVVLMEDTGPDAISIDSESGSVSITSSSMTSFRKVDLEAPQRFPHLLSVRNEEP